MGITFHISISVVTAGLYVNRIGFVTCFDRDCDAAAVYSESHFKMMTSVTVVASPGIYVWGGGSYHILILYGH